MRRARGYRASRIMLLLAVAIAPASARADMGPRFEDPRIIVRIARQGKPLPELFAALLLKPQPAGDSGDDPWADTESRASWVKEIDRARFTDPDGVRWVPLPRWWGSADIGRGTVDFHFRRESVPPRVRLALHLPEEHRVVITNEAPTRPYITELTVDLSSDGAASLGATPKWPLALVLGVLGENFGSLVLALLVTVILELLVVAACAWLRKGEPVRRLYRAVVFGNLITVPLVWFVSVYGKVESTPSWPVLFILAEVTAAAFEGWLYYRIARIPFGTALVWSALANGVTLLVGCCLVAFTL